MIENSISFLTEQDIEKFSRERTLALFRVGCNQKNFRILQMLPTTIDEIMEKLSLSKMPANGRVNKLVEVGLASRRIGEGIVEPTELADKFLKLIVEISKEVSAKVPEFLELLA